MYSTSVRPLYSVRECRTCKENSLFRLLSYSKVVCTELVRCYRGGGPLFSVCERESNCLQMYKAF